MDSNTALAFCYTKAAGLLSKSFVKNRTPLLFNAHSLVDLWSLLFNEPVPAVPEALLADQIESRAFNNLLNQYFSFLNQFDKPSALLLSQVQFFEIENLQSILDSLLNQESKPPKLIDLKGYSSINIKAYPDLEKMLHKTPYAWLHQNPQSKELQHIEFKLDLNFIKAVWDTMEHAKGEDKDLWEKLFLDEYTVKNIVWALRLSIYYQKNRKEIMDELFYVTDSANKLDPVAGPALGVLDKDVTNYEDWQTWKYKQYLNPYEGSDWKLDPAWFERRYMALTASRYIQFFHEHPLTEPALVAWFKAKLFELRCIRSAVECIRLNINGNDAMKALGILMD